MEAKEKRPKVGVGVVVIREGKVLLGKRKGSHGAGQWSFAGGHLEYGETVEACALRELSEETGLQATAWELGPWTSDVIDETRHYITFFVFVHEFQGQPQLLEPHKCEGWEWFHWQALPTPLFAPVSSLLQSLTKSPPAS